MIFGSQRWVDDHYQARSIRAGLPRLQRKRREVRHDDSVSAVNNGTLPAGLSLDTDYCLKTGCTNVIKCATQISVTADDTAVTITSAGTGTHTLTNKGKRDALRSSVASGKLILRDHPHRHTGFFSTAEWSKDRPFLPTRHGHTATRGVYASGINLLSTGALSHNYRFIGLELTTSQTGAADIATTVNPRPHGRLMALGQDSGNIIFDRTYIHGRGYPDRLGPVAIVWNGFNTAFVNSYLDQLDYWQPRIAGFTPSFNATSVTLTAGSGYGSRTLHPVTTSATVVAITGGAATGAATSTWIWPASCGYESPSA